jgi:hypothetical protein
MSSTKRQKTDPEIMIKIECLNLTSDQSFKKYVVLLHIITAMVSHGIKVLNKRSDILKDSSIQALNEELIYKNHFNINVKYANDKNSNPKSVCGIDNIQTLKKDQKAMNYLLSNEIHNSIHNWKEEECIRNTYS